MAGCSTAPIADFMDAVAPGGPPRARTAERPRDPLPPAPPKNTDPPLPPVPASQTPWEELYRAHTGQLQSGGALEFALKYRQTSKKTPRHNH